jgi:hypothetical protein
MEVMTKIRRNKMKKIIFVFVIAVMAMSVNLYGQTPEADYILTLDFSADQSNIPYRGYAAAYLVNTTDTVLAFESSLIGRVELCYYPDEYLPLHYAGRIMEVVIDDNAYEEKFRGRTFILHPGESVRIISAGFTLEDREKYPESYITGSAYVNRQKKRIVAFFQNQGETK